MADLVHSNAQSITARRNRRVGIIGLVLVASMVGLAYAAVPLYQLFCQVTGFGGTPQLASEAPKGAIARMMTVDFDANVANNLPWTVKAAAPVTDNIGEIGTVNYIATNHSDKPLSGMAVFNVSPEHAGVYFNKIECFCFTEQTLQPGETVEMPIIFFIDPELDKNRELNTIKEITLSYTFYASDNGGS